jgi:hypothetical protein
MFSGGKKLDSVVTVASKVFNRRSKAWEPLIEPWTLSPALVWKPSDPVFFRLVAGHRLNLVVTDTFLNNIPELLVALRFDEGPQTDERLHGAFCPNWVINETGHDVHVWPVFHPTQPRNDRPIASIPNKDAAEPTQPSHSRESAPPHDGQSEQDNRQPRAELVMIPTGEASRIHFHNLTRLRSSMSRLLARHRIDVRKRAHMLKHSSTTTTSRGSTLDPFESNTSIESDGAGAKVEECGLDELRNFFDSLDIDGNGTISALELQECLVNLGEPISVKEVLYEVGDLVNRNSSPGRPGERSTESQAGVAAVPITQAYDAEITFKDFIRAFGPVASSSSSSPCSNSGGTVSSALPANKVYGLGVQLVMPSITR